VEKHQLLIRVRVHILILELLVEFSPHLNPLLPFRSEDRGDGNVGDGFVGFRLSGPFLGEAFGSDDVCGGIGVGPGGEEDVVLEVWRDEVGDGGGGGEGGDFGADGGGEGDGGEDG